MVFGSGRFVVFLCLVLALYWWLAQHEKARLGVLLVASVAFYWTYSPPALLLFAWSATTARVATFYMHRTLDQRRRKRWLIFAVSSDLLILCIFKYGPLLSRTFGEGGGLGTASLNVSMLPAVILPVGLSFVVFMSVSYVVDTYRYEIVGEQPWVHIFIGYTGFAQVISGPILRAKDWMLRLRQVPALSAEEGHQALCRIATGMIKKMLIADPLGSSLVNAVFRSPQNFTSVECVAAVVAYTLQIYYDFSGYSDIAIGVAGLLGIRFPENFARPYGAWNLFQFWGRWHLTLSNWLRDYLYIPMGGNRAKRPRVLFNLFVVMALGGLWHGADWRFLLWGSLHGIALVASRIYFWARRRSPSEPPKSAFGWLVGIGLTFTWVAFTRIFFRASDLAHAATLMGRMAKGVPGAANLNTLFLVSLGLAVGLQVVPLRYYHAVVAKLFLLPTVVRALLLVGLTLALRSLSEVEVPPYIYLQF